MSFTYFTDAIEFIHSRRAGTEIDWSSDYTLLNLPYSKDNDSYNYAGEGIPEEYCEAARVIRLINEVANSKNISGISMPRLTGNVGSDYSTPSGIDLITSVVADAIEKELVTLAIARPDLKSLNVVINIWGGRISHSCAFNLEGEKIIRKHENGNNEMGDYEFSSVDFWVSPDADESDDPFCREETISKITLGVGKDANPDDDLLSFGDDSGPDPEGDTVGLDEAAGTEIDAPRSTEPSAIDSLREEALAAVKEAHESAGEDVPRYNLRKRRRTESVSEEEVNSSAKRKVRRYGGAGITSRAVGAGHRSRLKR